MLLTRSSPCATLVLGLRPTMSEPLFLLASHTDDWGDGLCLVTELNQNVALDSDNVEYCQELD